MRTPIRETYVQRAVGNQVRGQEHLPGRSDTETKSRRITWSKPGEGRGYAEKEGLRAREAAKAEVTSSTERTKGDPVCLEQKVGGGKWQKMIPEERDQGETDMSC